VHGGLMADVRFAVVHELFFVGVCRSYAGTVGTLLREEAALGVVRSVPNRDILAHFQLVYSSHCSWIPRPPGKYLPCSRN
jgi:hypothetical protein